MDLDGFSLIQEGLEVFRCILVGFGCIKLDLAAFSWIQLVLEGFWGFLSKQTPSDPLIGSMGTY